MGHLLHAVSAKNNNRRMRHSNGDNCLKSMLWEVMLRNTAINGATIVDSIKTLCKKNTALFIKHLWFNSNMECPQNLDALRVYRQRTYDLFGLTIDVFAYMCTYLDEDDIGDFNETSNFINYRLNPAEKHGYYEYLYSMQYGSDFLFKLQNAIGLKELCKRIVFNKYTLPYPDAKSLYDELQGSLPIYVLNSGKHIWNGDIFGNIVQYMDFQSLIQSSYVCRDWLRFIMTNTTLSKAPGSQCVEIHDSNLDNYDEYYSGDYLISGASHYRWMDYTEKKCYVKPKLRADNVFVYEATHMELKKYPKQIKVLKYHGHYPMDYEKYGYDDFSLFAKYIGKRTIPIYCVWCDLYGYAPQITECLIYASFYGKVCERSIWRYITKDICRYFYIKSPSWYRNPEQVFVKLPFYSNNKHLYMMDAAPCNSLLLFLRCGRMFETLFEHFFWSMRLKYCNGVQDVFDFVLKLPLTSPLKTIEILFVVDPSYKDKKWNVNGDPSEKMMHWIEKNWEKIACNSRIKSWKIGLFKETYPPSGIVHDIKDWFVIDQWYDFETKFYDCLRHSEIMDNKEVYKLWQSLYEPWFNILNSTFK